MAQPTTPTDPFSGKEPITPTGLPPQIPGEPEEIPVSEPDVDTAIRLSQDGDSADNSEPQESDMDKKAFESKKDTPRNLEPEARQ